MTTDALSIPMRRCKCTAGSKAGKPARCGMQTNHHSGYCEECRYRCCDLQRHNIDHSNEGNGNETRPENPVLLGVPDGRASARMHLPSIYEPCPICKKDVCGHFSEPKP